MCVLLFGTFNEVQKIQYKRTVIIVFLVDGAGKI